MENPFLPDVQLAVDKNFIGRTSIISRIDRNIQNRPQNMAFIGINGIGTSSIVEHSIMRQATALVDRGIFPIKISLDYIDNTSVFFNSILRQCLKEMRHKLTPAAQKSANEALESLEKKI